MHVTSTAFADGALAINVPPDPPPPRLPDDWPRPPPLPEEPPPDLPKPPQHDPPSREPPQHEPPSREPEIEPEISGKEPPPNRGAGGAPAHRRPVPVSRRAHPARAIRGAAP
jgi:hypothetical protein